MKSSTNVLAPRSSSEAFTESMQSILRALFISVLFCCLLTGRAFATIACPPSKLHETAQLAYVHDGDTLKLKDGRKIRLLGIDTPEVARNNRPAQNFAYQARDALRALIKTSNNKIGLSFGFERKDKYRRTLAHLYLANGTNIQAQLIQQGLATAYVTPPNDRMADCYRQAEAVAINKKLGIWSLPEYQVIPATQLKKSDRGFRRIQGEVTGIRQNSKTFWIDLQGPVRIRIAATDLHYFSLYNLQQLTGKIIRVRGWIHPKKKGHFMALRHPSSLITQPK